MKLNNVNENLESILSDHPTPFAIVYRPKLDNNTVDVFTGNFATYDTLDDISFDSFNYKQNKLHDVLALIPFKQIKEIGASFVLKRTYFATIKDYSIKKALSIFKKSLLNILIDNQELTFTKNTLSA